MEIETIEKRIKDIKNEIHSLDGFKESYEEVEVEVIEKQIDLLIKEKTFLNDLLESYFNEITGL
jgi:copper chaperone CopZ